MQKSLAEPVMYIKRMYNEEKTEASGIFEANGGHYV